MRDDNVGLERCACRGFISYNIEHMDVFIPRNKFFCRKEIQPIVPIFLAMNVSNELHVNSHLHFYCFVYFITYLHGWCSGLCLRMRI